MSPPGTLGYSPWELPLYRTMLPVPHSPPPRGLASQLTGAASRLLRLSSLTLPPPGGPSQPWGATRPCRLHTHIAPCDRIHRHPHYPRAQHFSCCFPPFTAPSDLTIFGPLSLGSPASTASTTVLSVSVPARGDTITGSTVPDGTAVGALAKFATTRRAHRSTSLTYNNGTTSGLYCINDMQHLAYLLLTKNVELDDDDATNYLLGTSTNSAAGEAVYYTIPTDAATAFYLVLTTPEAVGDSFVKGKPFKKADAAAAAIRHLLPDDDDVEHCFARLPGCLPIPFGLTIAHGPYDDNMSSILLDMDLSKRIGDRWARLAITFQPNLHATATTTETTKPILPSLHSGQKWGTSIFINPAPVSPAQEALWADEIAAADAIRLQVIDRHRTAEVERAVQLARDEMSRVTPSLGAPPPPRQVLIPGAMRDDDTIESGATFTMNSTEAQKAALAILLSAVAYDESGRAHIVPPAWTADAATIFDEKGTKASRNAWMVSAIKAKTTEFAESYDFQYRNVRMPRLSAIVIAYLSHGIINSEPCESVEEAKNVNGFSIYHCIPPTFQHTEKESDSHTKRKREDILGEHEDHKTKLDTSISAHTYLGWTQTLTSLTSNVTAIFAALAVTNGKELKAKKQLAPDLCTNLRHAALTWTQEKIQVWFEKHRRTNGHMPHFACTTIDNMICSRAELATNPTFLRYAMTDQWKKIPATDFLRINDIFYAAIDRFRVAAANGDAIPITPLWNNSQQKQREDATKRKEETARIEQLAQQLLRQRGLTLPAAGRTDGGGSSHQQPRTGDVIPKKQRTERIKPSDADKKGFIIYPIKGPLPLPDFPNEAEYRTCPGFIRTGAACRNPDCKGKHHGPEQMPPDIFRRWCNLVKNTPDMTWDLSTVPPHVLIKCQKACATPTNDIETIE